MLKSIYLNRRRFLYLRFVIWAKWACMVLAQQGQGSYSPISLNLVCTQLLPTIIKADGFSRHRTKKQGDSPTALPSREGGTPERASPLEGQG